MYPSSYIKDENISYLHFHKTYGHHIWQTGELSWGSTTSKVTWTYDHVATWSHVTNRKQYISTSPKAINAKLGKVEIYNKGPPSIKSFDTLNMWSNDHMTVKERYTSTSSRTMSKKLDREVGSNADLLLAKSHNMLITWSHKVI